MPVKKTVSKSMGSSSNSAGCYGGACSKCHSGKTLVIGILILLNVWFNVIGWAAFIGILLVLIGLMKWFKPSCPHCA